MHKRPSKQRFIAASYCCTTKNVSAILTQALKLIYKAHKIYCDRIKMYTGYNFMWIIQNSNDVHEIFQAHRSKARNLHTFDFSTLYTSIPHDKLKQQLTLIVLKAFKGMNKKFIHINNNQARWAKDNNRKKGLIFDSTLVIEMLVWLIDNTYVSVGNKIFRQEVGIPMGTDCAPYLANLFLFAYEFDFMNTKLKEKDFETLRKFTKCCRYIDDLLAINNDNFMIKLQKVIYPPELSLTCEDKDDQKVNYLDLNISIKDHKFSYKLFDKRDNFDFPIVNFPNLSGNIPRNQSYGTFTAQLIRYARGCQHFPDFEARAKTLTKRLLQQNFVFRKLRATFFKFTDKYFSLIRKYGSVFKRDLALIADTKQKYF